MSAAAEFLRQPPTLRAVRDVEPRAVAPAAPPASAPRRPLPRPRVVVAVVSALMVLAGAVWLVVELGRHPVDSVRIAAEFRHLGRADLEQAVEPHLGGSFFAVDVAAVRDAARALPWVREASVRRVWPGSLHVAIVEREAAFRWGATGLLEDDATLFRPADTGGFEALPLLDGPDGTEHEVRELYGRMSRLLAPLRRRVDELSVSARGAWRARLDDGIELVLGRNPSDAALTRLARAFPAVLSGQAERIEAIDLRYANGFAVRWKPLPAAEVQG